MQTHVLTHPLTRPPTPCVRCAGISDFTPADIDIVGYRVFLGNGLYFVSSDVGGGKMQWYGFHKEAAGGSEPAGSRKKRLLELFGQWNDNVVDLIKATPEEDILRRDIFDRCGRPGGRASACAVDVWVGRGRIERGAGCLLAGREMHQQARRCTGRHAWGPPAGHVHHVCAICAPAGCCVARCAVGMLRWAHGSCLNALILILCAVLCRAARRPPIFSWAEGRVALLGDSAHAMQPNLGQGGCMAIEDGYALAVDLGRAIEVRRGVQ